MRLAIMAVDARHGEAIQFADEEASGTYKAADHLECECKSAAAFSCRTRSSSFSEESFEDFVLGDAGRVFCEAKRRVD